MPHARGTPADIGTIRRMTEGGSVGAPRRTVSVVIPLLNDADGIEPCLGSILAQAGSLADVREILVVDGGSTDGSRALVETLASADGRIRILDNPDRFVPQAMNRAIREARGDVIVRVDSHTTIAEDYVDAAVAVLDETGADAVAGPMRPTGASRFGEAVAWAMSSRWGIGGSRFHLEDQDCESESAYMGVFPRWSFERFGLYNTAFRRNQDDELTYRIRELGGRVWLSPRLRSIYTPRGDALSLFRQFRGYGRFKPLVLLAHPTGARVRHLIPAASAAAWLALPLSIKWPAAGVPAACHLVAVTGAAARATQGGLGHRVAALMAMHLGYGFGFLAGLGHLAAGERPGEAPRLAPRAVEHPGDVGAQGPNQLEC